MATKIHPITHLFLGSLKPLFLTIACLLLLGGVARVFHGQMRSSGIWMLVLASLMIVLFAFFSRQKLAALAPEADNH